MDRVRGVVRAGAGDDLAPAAELRHGELEQAQRLVVGERRALAGGAGHDDAVGAVVEQVAEERDERVLVDAAVVSERRQRGCDDAPVSHRG
jgi:hypothetical protein